MSSDDSLSHVGANIRAIRRRRHISQATLANRLGMRPGPVNCIELGRNLPSARVLHKLSQALDVPIDAFFSPTTRVGETPPVKHQAGNARSLAFRHANTVQEAQVPYMALEGDDMALPRIFPARSAEELRTLSAPLIEKASVLADAFLALEDICGASKTAELPLNLPFERSESGIQSLCVRVRRMLGIGEAVIFDYLELFENAGLRVLFAPLPEGVESFSGHDIANGNAFFFVEARGHTPERQLFRLCYELGRLYVHAHEHYRGAAPERIGVDRRRKPFTEDRTARRFSALFLMPEPALYTTVRQIGIRPNEWSFELLCRVKHRFGVSAEALLYRLRECSLITQRLLEEFKAVIESYYADHANSEPDASRRLLSPNGRLGDLLLTAMRRKRASSEAAIIADRLTAMHLPGLERGASHQ